MSTKTDKLESVYVVKVETRSPDAGHPVVIPAALAVNECYRTKPYATAVLREMAARHSAYELTRAAHRPSPASLNVIPAYDDGAESLQVFSMEGMIYRYFIDKMPIV